jgi:integrase
MASITKQKSGCRTIQFVGAGRRRKSIRLGKVSQRQAESFKFRVEQLIAAQRSGVPVDADTSAWLTKLDDTMVDRLAAVGLIPGRKKKGQANLGSFLDGYMKRRTDVKPATREVWRQVMLNLKNFFGVDRAVESITEGDAEDFKLFLIGEDLASTTVHKRLQFTRMFFRDAKKRNIILENPFIEVKAKAVALKDRQRFITREEMDQIMAVCNSTWRTIVGLARYGGLRCPSEVLSLRWKLVDWEHDRMVADSPKTEHHPGGAQRVVPIFPELRPILEEAFELAEPGAEFVVGGNYRAAAMGEKGWTNCNLRTQLERLIRRAGLTPWPRLLHNLRASRETELAAEFPLHVVTCWLGNTPRIAMKHYLQVTDDNFARAAGRATASPEPPALDTKSGAPARNPAAADAPARKDAPHNKSTRTGGYPGDCKPADQSDRGSGDSGRDPSRDRNRPVERAAECGAVSACRRLPGADRAKHNPCGDRGLCKS